jgi:hypothetical protein
MYMVFREAEDNKRGGSGKQEWIDSGDDGGCQDSLKHDIQVYFTC